jgi:hypothetical protein
MPSDFLEITEPKNWYVHDRPPLDPERYRLKHRNIFVSSAKSSSWRGVSLALPVSRSSRASQLAQAFRSLAESWYAQTAFESSFTKIVMNLNYLRIISLGEDVVPLILQELERKSAPWFLALKAITGFDPVPDGNAGDFRLMTEAWLAWGRDRGLI